MTRFEEKLHLETAWRPHTRVRLRKYIVTEMVTTTVPVRREEVRLEREPITGAERVRLKKETITDEHTVSEAVPKEQMEASVEGGGSTGGGSGPTGLLKARNGHTDVSQSRKERYARRT